MIVDGQDRVSLFIDVSVIAGEEIVDAGHKPEKDKHYGKPLYRERVQMKSGKGQYKCTVDREPEKAGIDPFRLMIDRLPDDNLKKVTIGE